MTLPRNAAPLVMGVVFWLLTWHPALAQDIPSYESESAGQFMRDWLLLGPISVSPDPAVARDSRLQRQSFETEHVDSRSLAAARDGASLTIEDRPMKWRRIRSQQDAIDLEQLLGEHDFVSVYALAEIAAPADTTLLLALGSDDGLRVSMNGSLIHETWIGRGLTIDQDIIPVRLKAGRNRLLVKIQDMEYGWGFSCRLLDPVKLQRWRAIEFARSLVGAMLMRSEAPGISAAVGIDGEVVWAEGFGFADVENQVPVSERTLFRIGSVSKPLAAAALAILIENGRVDLDAPVQQYVPSFPVKRWPISTRQLAGHLAGVRHYRDGEFLSSTRYETVLQGLEIFAGDTLLFEPNTRYSYSSYAWNLVSAVIEGASGIPFLELMHASVFRPLGMTETVADWNDRIIPNRSDFYERRPDRSVVNAPHVDNSYKWAGGGFLSTATDLVRFGMGHLDESLMSAETVDLLWTSQRTSAGEDTGYGLGWYTGVDPDGRRFVQHGGGSVGGSAFLLVFPAERVVVSLLSNARAPIGYWPSWTIADRLLTMPVELTPPDRAISNASGHYRCRATEQTPEPEDVEIQLLGDPADYWGRVLINGRPEDIISATVTGHVLHITTLGTEGSVSDVGLSLGAETMTGRWNAVELECRIDPSLPGAR